MPGPARGKIPGKPSGQRNERLCMKPLLAATFATAVVMFLILVAVMCDQRLMRAVPTAPAADLPGSHELQPSR